jgi:hypothetical protein
MKKCYEFLGKNAFRVSNYINSNRTRPINMALYETIGFLMTYNFSSNHKNNIKTKLHYLLGDEDFIDAITSPVDSSVKVNERFILIRDIAEEKTHD